MPYTVQWTRNAAKQARKLPQAGAHRGRGRRLEDWPACIAALDIKTLQGHAHQYRFRVGRYRSLFDVESGVRVVRVERVRKRDERTH